MTWYDRFNDTSTINGSTLAERYKNDLQSSWEKYFEETPNRQTIEIDGVEETVVIQHMRYGEDKYDVQLLLTQNTTEANYGKIILWKTRSWLIINAEERAIDTHKSWKILLMQNSMKSKDSNGNIEIEPCHISTKSSRSDGNSSVTLTDSSWVIRVQKNVNTLKYFVNQRFLFDNKVAYKIVNLNYSEFENQISITLEPTQILSEDDLDNNIAYNNIKIDTTPVTGKNGVFFTKDNLKIAIGNSEEVEVYEYLNDVIIPLTTFTFRIDDIDSNRYEIINQDDNSITIKSLGYYYLGTLVAVKNDDSSEYNIPLTLSSALG